MADSFGLSCFVRADRLFGYVTPGGAMAYPTSPSGVGLTVAKSSLTVITANTNYTTSQTVSNTFFQRQVHVRDGATVEFDNCWFVANQTVYAFGDVVVRIGVTSSAVFANCEFGITAADAQTYMGGDGTWVAAYGSQVGIDCPNNGHSGTVLVSSCYFHHLIDGIRPQGGWTIEDSYIADLTLNLPDFHNDCIQFIRGIAAGETATIRRCYLSCNIHPDTVFVPGTPEALTGAPNRAVFVKPDEDDIDGSILIDGCYLDGEGFYPASTSSDEIYGFGPDASVVWSNNVIGRSATVDEIVDQSPSVWVSTFDNNTLEGSQMAATVEAQGSAIATSGDVTLTLSADAETDDWLIVGLDVRNAADTVSVSGGAGSWVLETDESLSTTLRKRVYKYKVVSGDTPGTTSFTFDISNNFRTRSIVWAVVRGADTTDCVDVSADVLDNTGNTTRDAPAVTTTADDHLVLAFMSSQSDNDTFGTPTSPTLTQVANARTGGVTLTSYLFSFVQATAGSTGTITATAGVNTTSLGATIAIKSAAGSAFSGSGTPSQAAQTSTASGTFTAPTFTGTSAVAQVAQTATGTGTFSPPVFTGSGAPTQANQIADGSGEFTQVFAGSGALTQGDQLASGSATFTAVFVGSGSPTQGDDTSSGSGNLSVTFTGSGAPTQANQIATGVGSVLDELKGVIHLVGRTSDLALIGSSLGISLIGEK